MIDIGIDITDVLRINDKEYGVEFSSYFNVMWREPRLYIPHIFLGEWNSSMSGEEAEEESSDALIPVNLELVKQLWLPNIFIYNLKTFKVSNISGAVKIEKKSVEFSKLGLAPKILSFMDKLGHFQRVFF